MPDWLKVNQTVLASSGSAPDRMFLIRYEDLVRSAEQIIREIIAFLGEDPALLHIDQVFTMKHDCGYQDSQIRTTSTVHALSIGRSAALGPGEIGNIRDIVGELAGKFGYTVHGASALHRAGGSDEMDSPPSFHTAASKANGVAELPSA